MLSTLEMFSRYQTFPPHFEKLTNLCCHFFFKYSVEQYQPRSQLRIPQTFLCNFNHVLSTLLLFVLNEHHWPLPVADHHILNHLKAGWITSPPHQPKKSKLADKTCLNHSWSSLCLWGQICSVPLKTRITIFTLSCFWGSQQQQRTWPLLAWRLSSWLWSNSSVEAGGGPSWPSLLLSTWLSSPHPQQITLQYRTDGGPFFRSILATGIPISGTRNLKLGEGSKMPVTEKFRWGGIPPPGVNICPKVSQSCLSEIFEPLSGRIFEDVYIINAIS